jgi:hypothetical protein
MQLSATEFLSHFGLRSAESDSSPVVALGGKGFDKHPQRWAGDRATN